jgi:predicted DNA-binding transcriptional regulator AlpA
MRVSTTDQTGTKKRNKTTYVPKQLPDDPSAFVRKPTVLEVLSISNTAFYEGIKNKKYPPGRLLSPRCRVWTAGEIRELLEKLKSGCAA